MTHYETVCKQVRQDYFFKFFFVLRLNCGRLHAKISMCYFTTIKKSWTPRVQRTSSKESASMATITIPTGVTSTGLIIEAGDILNIQAGGSATNTTENGGAVNITDGGYADFIANTIIGLTVNNAVMTVHKNTV